MTDMKALINALPTSTLIEVRNAIDDTLSWRQDHGQHGPKHWQLTAEKLAYLPELMSVDMSARFGPAEGPPDYYVYLHLMPSICPPITLRGLDIQLNRQPFYVGKGCRDRAYDMKGRSTGHRKRLRSILETGLRPEDIALIVRDNLTSNEAFELEAKLIYVLGSIYDDERGCLLNIATPELDCSKGSPVKTLVTHAG